MASISWTAIRIKFEGSLFIDSPQARYIVIFTTEKQLNSSSPFSTFTFIPIIFPGIVIQLPAGWITVRIPHSPFGMLHIEIADKPLPVEEEKPSAARLRKRIHDLHAAQGENDILFGFLYDMSNC